MGTLHLLAILLILSCVAANPGWGYGGWNKYGGGGYGGHHHHHGHGGGGGGGDLDAAGSDGDDYIPDRRNSGGFRGGNRRRGGVTGRSTGCSCLLYVERTQVFQRIDRTNRYRCDRNGVEQCSAYCLALFADEGLRASSRQDACDVLGRNVNTSWYRRDQVCGSNGPSRDTPLTANLCCQGGRSVPCT